MFENNLTLSALSPVVAYDDDTKLFFCDDKTVGYSFICIPACGGGEELQQQLQSFLSLEFVEDTTISFMLYRSPDIDSQLDQMILLRNGFYDELLSPMLQDRCQFLREHTEKPLITRRDGAVYDCGRIVDIKLFVTVKIPVKDGCAPTDSEMSFISELQRRSFSSLRECGFAPIEMNEAQYLRVMSTIFNWGKGASWKNSIIKPDPSAPTYEQFFDSDTDLDASDKKGTYISLGEKMGNFKKGDDYECYIQVLSPKSFPTSFYFGDAIMYPGDPSGRGRSTNISGNYAVVSTLHYVNHTTVFDKIKRKRNLTSKAAFSQVLLKARPELADAIRDYDEIYDSVQSGAHLVEASFEVILFSRTHQELLDTSQAMCQYFSVLGFKLMVDKMIQRELFTNCLPLSLDRDFMFGMESKRYQTLTNGIASVLLPIFAEWKGTGTGHVALISRTGQLMTVSLNDSATNNNALIAAESGSGKSFYTNELMSMYMSEGARVWIIDIGRSYLKLCNILHGDFISFDPNNLPCMNPFKMVRDINEEHDSVVAILSTMISPNGTLGETQESILVRIFDEQWTRYGNNLTIDLMEQALFEYATEYKDKRVEDMAIQIYEYTSKGPYGNVFNDGEPVNMMNRLTVLELEELSAFPALRRIILLQLIFQIQQAIYLNPDRSQRKLVMIDEAWDLLKEGQTSKFMEGAYRKFRKYGASAIIATQAISDLYNSAEGNVGQAIANNSAFYFLLGQKPATIEQVKEKKQMDLSEGGFELLKTVRTQKGVFSEIFIQSNAGTGIGRLIVSDFEKLMFSTDARDIERINQYIRQGATYSEAINQILVDDDKVDYEDLKRSKNIPIGRLLSKDEINFYAKLRHKIVTNETLLKVKNSLWSPLHRRLVYEDGSNVVNPKDKSSVGIIYETKQQTKNSLITQTEGSEAQRKENTDYVNKLKSNQLKKQQEQNPETLNPVHQKTDKNFPGGDKQLSR